MRAHAHVLPAKTCGFVAYSFNGPMIFTVAITPFPIPGAKSAWLQQEDCREQDEEQVSATAPLHCPSDCLICQRRRFLWADTLSPIARQHVPLAASCPPPPVHVPSLFFGHCVDPSRMQIAEQPSTLHCNCIQRAFYYTQCAAYNFVPGSRARDITFALPTIRLKNHLKIKVYNELLHLPTRECLKSKGLFVVMDHSG